MGDTNTRISENAARALGSFAVKSRTCDYSKELIVDGAVNVLCTFLTSPVRTLRLHSLLALEVLFKNRGDDVTHQESVFQSPLSKDDALVESVEIVLADSQYEVERNAAINLLRMMRR